MGFIDDPEVGGKPISSVEATALAEATALMGQLTTRFQQAKAVIDAARRVELDTRLTIMEDDTHYCLCCGIANVTRDEDHHPWCAAVKLRTALKIYDEST